jgi:tetratricopeptide (TPR) repeat protein
MRSYVVMVATALLLCSGGLAAQSTPVVQHEANFDSERARANEMFLKNDRLQALPLYEDLARQDPTVAVFAERMGSGLVAAADIETDPAKKEELHQRSVAAFRRAKQLGDNSPLVETMLGMEEDRQRALAETKASPSPSKTAPPAPNPLSSNPQALEWMQKAETAFAKNDVDTAFADYKRASEIDPSSYMARLYTGDACFRKGDYACAGEWFGKAISLDPNRETAYRYWGDALYKSGHSLDAKAKYEQAIVAEPYSRLSWGGLSQWATLTKTSTGSPPIQRPTFTTGANGGTNLNMPAGMAAGDAGVWAYYGACRISSDRTRAQGQRRTVDGELHCLEAAADYAQKNIADKKLNPDTLGPGVKALLALKADAMLECWLLLNGADREILQDYPAYRDGHRELLTAYLNKYVLH